MIEANIIHAAHENNVERFCVYDRHVFIQSF